MKKTCSVFVVLLLLALSLCTPALAFTEYGVIYDETEELGSATLTMQGEQTLPELSEELGIDLRVDVLTQISYDGAAARPWPTPSITRWSPPWPSGPGTARRLP